MVCLGYNVNNPHIRKYNDMTIRQDNIEPLPGALQLECVGLGTFILGLDEIRQIVDRNSNGARIKTRDGLFYNLTTSYQEVMEALSEARMMQEDMRN